MAKTIRCVTISVLMLAAVSSQAAQANCWKADQVRAAAVRDLETMLMVSALRCRNGADDFMPSYNAFVASSRPALGAVNGTLRQHFTESVGAADALNAYDSFVVRIANRYGAGVAGLNCGDMQSILKAVATEGATVDALAAVADRAGVEPLLDAPRCAMRVATLTH